MPAMAMYLLGLGLLVLGADSVLRGAAGLGQRLGLPAFLAGLLMAGFVAAIPELSVASFAVAGGEPALAMGAALGASAAGIALGLGALALVAPFVVSMRVAAPMLICVLVAAGLVQVFAYDGQLVRWEGGALLFGYLAAMVLWWRRAREEPAAAQAAFAGLATTATGLAQNLLRLGFAAALLYFGSRFVVRSAPGLGAVLGLDAFSTGLSLVAFGVALPKFVFLAMAARGEGNVAVSAVLGACLASLLLATGAFALLQPMPVAGVTARFALPVAMAFALALYLLLGSGMRIERRRGAFLFAGGIAWLACVLLAARA